MASDLKHSEMKEEEEQFSSNSYALRLYDDGAGGRIERVLFERDEREGGDIDAAAAHLLGIDGERVRCFSLPYLKKQHSPDAPILDLPYVFHMYIDLQGIEHKMQHNTNATQFWLCANLPREPPDVMSSIHGPVLLTAEHATSEKYMDLDMEDWAKIKAFCKAFCPDAMFADVEASATVEVAATSPGKKAHAQPAEVATAQHCE